jgi:hypothetical protein
VLLALPVDREVGGAVEQAVGPVTMGLPSEVLASERAGLGQEQATHPWRKAWRRRQQRAAHAGEVARR